MQMLTLTPVVCILAGIAFSTIFEKFICEETIESKKIGETKEAKESAGIINCEVINYQ